MIRLRGPEGPLFHGGARTAVSVPTGNPANAAAAFNSEVHEAKFIVGSVPDSADVEVDGSFVGNTPSEIAVAEGEHTIAVKKSGFKNWERKMKVSGGSSIHLNAELEKADPTPPAQ